MTDDEIIAAARLSARYFQALLVEGVGATDAANMTNSFVIYTMAREKAEAQEKKQA
jgi:hypothetical protein